MARRRLLYHYFYLTYGGERYSEEVTVSPFSPDGGADGFSVMSSKAWEVLSSPSWLWISPVEGEKGMTQVQVSAGTHAGSDVREDNITIRTIDGRYTAMIHVSQAADVPYITVNGQTGSTQISVPFRNTQTVLSVSSKGGWTAAVTGATLAPTAQTNVERVVTETVVTYESNTSTSDTRTVTVVFTNTQDPTKSVTVTIVQAPQSYIDLEWAAGTPELLPWNGWDGTVVVETNISSYLNASEGVTITPSEVTAGTTNTSAHMPGSSTAGPITYAIFGNTSDLDSDGIDSDSISIVMEAKPYLEVPDITIQSGETAGTVTYVSNYAINPNSFTGAGISEIVVEGDILTVKMSSTPLWNEDRTLTLQVETIGTVGPSMTQTVNVTQKGKVAELTASGHTTNKNAGSTFITFTTNDTITVDTTGFPSWLSFDRIDYDEGKVWFTVTENTGTGARDHDITLTTTHNGADGQPVSQTVTLTQGANADTRTNVTVNARLKQNSSGRWYLITDTTPSAINDFRFTMSYGNAESITALTNESDLRVVTGGGGQTAVGTKITVRGFNPATYDAGPNPGGGENYYDITYISSATVYSTWVSGYDEVELKSLNYANTVIPASGGSVTPTSYTVSYREVIANSFDDSTSLSELKEITINSKPGSISGITSNGGTITSSTSVVNAPSRGTVEGVVWNVAEITAVTFNFSGNTYTDRNITNVVITQQKNEAYCNEGEIKKRTGSRTETKYRNSGFTTNPTGFTYPASGGTKKFTVNVSAQTRVDTAITYNVTPYSACTYDSGYDEPPICGQTTTETETSHGTWRDNYSAATRFWKASGDTSWFNTPSTGGNSPITVTATTRGTTAGSARPNAYLVFDSPLNRNDEVTIPIRQDANIMTSAETYTGADASSAATTSLYDTGVWFDPSSGTFGADGNGSPKTVHAYESGHSRTDTAWTITSSWTINYDYTSGAHTSAPGKHSTTAYTEQGREIKLERDITANVAANEGVYIKYTAPSYVGAGGTASTTSMGTAVTSGDTMVLSVTGTLDTSKTASASFTQNANEITGTKWIDIRRGVTISAETVTNCHLDVIPTTFTARTGVMSAMVVVKSAVDTEKITGVTADKYDVYTSNASALVANDFVVSANPVTTLFIPVKPTSAWTTPSTYGANGSLTYQNLSSYTYSVDFDLALNPPSSTVGNGVLKFSNPSGSSSCTGRTQFYYSGTTPATIVYPIIQTYTVNHPTNLTYGATIRFDYPSNITKNVSWKFVIHYHFVDTLGGVDNGTFSITGKTTSSGIFSITNVSDNNGNGRYSTESQPSMGSLLIIKDANGISGENFDHVASWVHPSSLSPVP